MFAVVMVVFYCVLHFSLVYLGKSMVAAAAQDGLAAAQKQDGDEADGVAAANEALTLTRNVEITSPPVVSIDSTNSEVTVTISGRVDTVMVDLLSDFTVTVTGPKERFYDESERP